MVTRAHAPRQAGYENLLLVPVEDGAGMVTNLEALRPGGALFLRGGGFAEIGPKLKPAPPQLCLVVAALLEPVAARRAQYGHMPAPVARSVRPHAAMRGRGQAASRQLDL